MHASGSSGSMSHQFRLMCGPSQLGALHEKVAGLAFRILRSSVEMSRSPAGLPSQSLVAPWLLLM